MIYLHSLVHYSSPPLQNMYVFVYSCLMVVCLDDNNLATVIGKLEKFIYRILI